MRFDRRQFVFTTLMTSAFALTPHATLAGLRRRPGRGYRRLVIVQLNGGNDPLNTLVPFEDARYHAARPNLAIAPDAVHRVDELNGFHPALGRTATLFREGRMAVQRGIGYAGSNLSHFRSIDIWEAASTAEKRPHTGWLGRLADAQFLEEESPITMLAIGRDVLPHSMRAEESMACALPNLEDYRIRTGGATGESDARARRRVLEQLNGVGAGGEAVVSSAVGVANASIAALETAARTRSETEYPTTKLAQELAVAARVIEADLPTRVFYITQGGYDTHAFQAGRHEELLTTFDRAMSTFVTDLERIGALEDTLVVTVSEFGRRVEENGIAERSGTDHGAASLAMYFGGGIAPGLHGGQPDLEDLDENGNLRHAIDFRSEYATIIERWFGGDAAAVLGQTYEPIDALRA